MKLETFRAIVLRGFAVVVVVAVAGQAQDAKTPYPSMAPLDQYLMARDAEIALARSAAPESISKDAEIMVLGQHGYETAVKGKNGFVCIVERGWTAGIDDPSFWNPKLRGPLCLNAAAARSYLPRTIKKTDLILAGRSKAQMFEGLRAALDKKEVAGDRARCDLLHVVQARVLERPIWTLASAHDVLRSTDGACALGCRLAGLAGHGADGR